MLASMDAAQAIADLTEISPQVTNVAAAGADGAVLGSNLPDDEAASTLLERARKLLASAEELRPGVAQIEAATVDGSVFVVRDGERLIAATTTPEPTVGLVFYDLKTCLRSIEAAKPKPQRRPAKKKEADDAAA
jgi:predicted regulator of Ras-like GTPase activity (Roadblock/LC7/MglB family)